MPKQLEASSTETPDTSTHWVHCMSKGDMRDQSTSWIENRRDSFDENYDEIKRKNGKLFAHIDNDSILHIYAHGHKDKVVIFQNENELTPKDLLDFLKNEGLSSKHKFLELDTCYSNKFAEQLAIVAKEDYPDLCITGFPEQFVLCQGNNYENLANLTTPFVVNVTSANSILSKIDENEFNKHPEAKRDEFIAKHHAVHFYTNPQKENEAENQAESSTDTEENKESNSPTVSRRVTRSSGVGVAMAYQTPLEQDSSLISSELSDFEPSPKRGSIIQKPSYQSILRESIPGKCSWVDVEQRSTTEPTENNNNSVNASPAEDKLLKPTIIEKELELMKQSQNNDTITNDNSTPTNHFKP